MDRYILAEFLPASAPSGRIRSGLSGLATRSSQSNDQTPQLNTGLDVYELQKSLIRDLKNFETTK